MTVKGSKDTIETVKYAVKSVLILLLFVSIFQRFADKLVESDLYTVDLTIMGRIQSWISPKFTSVMIFFTFFGSAAALLLFLIISASLMYWQHKRWEALFLIAAFTGGVVFNLLLKWIFQRQRPNFIRLIEETGYSFPSGHSMISFVFYGMLSMLFILFLNSRVLKMIILIITSTLIIMVGLSRVYLGVHYPSDVLAGFAAGGAWITICLLGLRFVLDFRRSSSERPNSSPY